MNPKLKDYLLSLNCTVINPVLEKLGSKNIVGWHCKSTSLLRKNYHITSISLFMLKNNLEYYLADGNNTEFFIYKLPNHPNLGAD